MEQLQPRTEPLLPRTELLPPTEPLLPRTELLLPPPTPRQKRQNRLSRKQAMARTLCHRMALNAPAVACYASSLSKASWARATTTWLKTPTRTARRATSPSPISTSLELCQPRNEPISQGCFTESKGESVVERELVS